MKAIGYLIHSSTLFFSPKEKTKIYDQNQVRTAELESLKTGGSDPPSPAPPQHKSCLTQILFPSLEFCLGANTACLADMD